MDDLNFIECILIQSYYRLINPDFFQRQGDTKKFPRNAFMGCLNALIVDCFILDPPVYPITSKEHRNSIQRECHDLYGKSPALSPARFWKALRAEIMSSWSSNFCKMPQTQINTKGYPKNGALVWHTENCCDLCRIYQEIYDISLDLPPSRSNLKVKLRSC